MIKKKQSEANTSTSHKKIPKKERKNRTKDQKTKNKT
jgi:hypothetical protein